VNWLYIDDYITGSHQQKRKQHIISCT